MEQLEYRVCFHLDQWKVLLDKYYGPYADQQHAIVNAVEAAQRSGRSGRPGTVLLQDPSGTWVTCWQYGDPFPYRAPSAAEPSSD